MNEKLSEERRGQAVSLSVKSQAWSACSGGGNALSFLPLPRRLSVCLSVSLPVLSHTHPPQSAETHKNTAERRGAILLLLTGLPAFGRDGESGNKHRQTRT